MSIEKLQRKKRHSGVDMYNDLNKNFRSGLSGRLDPAEESKRGKINRDYPVYRKKRKLKDEHSLRKLWDTTQRSICINENNRREQDKKIQRNYHWKLFKCNDKH